MLKEARLNNKPDENQMKLSGVYLRGFVIQCLSFMHLPQNMSMAQLLTLVKEVEALHQQVLQWRDKHQGSNTDKQALDDGWAK